MKRNGRNAGSCGSKVPPPTVQLLSIRPARNWKDYAIESARIDLLDPATSRPLSAYAERLADIGRALAAGTIPLIWMADDSTDLLRSYAALSVRGEVKQEALVRNAGGFFRFLDAISFSHGAQLNISSVSREAAIERKTVSGFVSILHDLLLSFELPVFQKRAKRQGLQRPKFYFVDAGPFRSLRPVGPLDSPEETAGAAFEGLVLQTIRAVLAYAAVDASLYFRRTRHGLEVDCIGHGAGLFAAVEITPSAMARPEEFLMRSADPGELFRPG